MRRIFKLIYKSPLFPQDDEINLRKQERKPLTWVRGGLSHPLAQESYAYSSIKIPTRVNSFARPCSPKGLFCGSHPSATSYSNGLTGEEESDEEEEEEAGVVWWWWWWGGRLD